MMDLKHEISRVQPDDPTIQNSTLGIPILKAYECVLYELETDYGFTYTAVNINTGKSQTLSRRKSPLSPSDIEQMAAGIRSSRIAGKGRLEVERPFGECMEIHKAHEILSEIITGILPCRGYSMPPEQITYSKHILNNIYRRSVSLAETEANADNTLAYLIPAVIAKLGRLNDFHNLSLYPEMPYADMAYMPIIIAASNAAFQKTLVNDYIPVLSKVLLDAGVIKRPLSAALRKGREHYICEHNIRIHLPFERDHNIRQILNKLLSPSASINLMYADELAPQLKAKITVPPRCPESCPHKEGCRFLAFCEKVQSPSIDIQVCSHHYLLTDTLRRVKGKRALLPNYQILIIDEAHKFHAAARRMYRSELLSVTAPELLEIIDSTAFQYETARKMARTSAKKLVDESKKLFRGLAEQSALTLDADAVRHLRNIRDIADRITMILRGEVFRVKAGELLAWVQEKYDADTSMIDLYKLIPATIYDAPNLERQKVIMRTQANHLFKAVCGLREVKHGADIERQHRQQRFSGNNPERQALQNDVSAVFNSVWHKIKDRLINENVASSKSESLLRLIWEYEAVRDQAAALAKHGALTYWLEADSAGSRLYATPKDLDNQLFNDLWSKGVPVILASDNPPTAAVIV